MPNAISLMKEEVTREGEGEHTSVGKAEGTNLYNWESPGDSVKGYKVIGYNMDYIVMGYSRSENIVME